MGVMVYGSEAAEIILIFSIYLAMKELRCQLLDILLAVKLSNVRLLYVFGHKAAKMLILTMHLARFLLFILVPFWKICFCNHFTAKTM